MGTFIEKTGTNKTGGSAPSQIRIPSTPMVLVSVPVTAAAPDASVGQRRNGR